MGEFGEYIREVIMKKKIGKTSQNRAEVLLEDLHSDFKAFSETLLAVKKKGEATFEEVGQMREEMGFMSDKQGHLEKKIDNMSDKQGHLEKKIDNMSDKQGHLEKKIDNMSDRQRRLEKKVEKIESKVDKIEKDMRFVKDELRLIRNELKQKISLEEFNILEERVMKLEKTVDALS